jgi:hypothetical protein
VLLALLLLGCRTSPWELPPGDLSSTDLDARDLTSHDLQARDLALGDLSPPPDAMICNRDHPNGWCPSGFSCCAFDCWGGSDATGWCAAGSGCPAC